jgi:glycosyltransferase involved in cell wall biosynthesis
VNPSLSEAETPTISIVVPVYGGETTVGPLVQELVEILGAESLEIVLVNDASPDDSERVCLELVAKYPNRVVYVALSRNFGEHNAVMAGLRLARGDFVVTMDDDLQNPPSEVPRLLQEARRGYDVVYAQLVSKQHHWFRNFGSRFNDKVATRLLGKPPSLYLSTFRCLSRFLVDEVVRYDGPYPYVDGLILRSTSRIGTVFVRHEPRASGESGYTLRKLLTVWLNMSTSFSILPLRVVVAAGLATAFVGACFGIEVIVEKVLHPNVAIGWASLMTMMVVLGGIQLIVIGTIGEYVGRLLLTVNRTPQSAVRTIVRGKDVPVRAQIASERARR